MALLQLKNVSLAYEGRLVIDNISLAVNEGNLLSIVGENGSGKTTLVKAILRLRPVDKGEIIFGDGLKRSDVGYLPQQTSIQRDLPARVDEVVLSGCLNSRGMRPFYNKEEKNRAAATLESLKIGDLARACYRELSGGQQQRVLLARALMATRKLILLDEPAAGLDPLVTKELYKLIGELNKEHGVTIIMVSHDVGSAMTFSSHILHLGKYEYYYGPAADYRDSAAARLLLGGNSHA